jgi:ubiquinone/menaquinone biosynthesis C-methylase UbiE
MNIEQLIPPEELVYAIGGNYEAIGREFFGHFVNLGGLQPTDRVLDVGCGSGRMALPLTQYLTDTGGYEGFDIMPKCIAWCQTRITPHFPHFHFQLADVYNLYYNPTGRSRACDYRFPYEDESFDFVFLTSVFTHMLPDDLENYFYEIARVLKVGGRCVITYFLLNAESERLQRARRGPMRFKYRRGVYRTTTPSKPEDAVCYNEPHILELYPRYGLSFDKVHYGNWSERPDSLTFQDLIAATKTRRLSASERPQFPTQPPPEKVSRLGRWARAIQARLAS